ncbi:uncharacterized protein LOC102806133 [Saccoglossus kowalevskii]|uniref:Uncharacterized protein LOC102806133 n=1 Tax=Saccoglossus kowalevskii TaxID=10224 RepID=A0ABM0MDF9_SACKO|nr:PREDICTED: uncharacterized protein LOC102806133 [Saccoglossus kowalevskii]
MADLSQTANDRDPNQRHTTIITKQTMNPVYGQQLPQTLPGQQQIPSTSSSQSGLAMLSTAAGSASNFHALVNNPLTALLQEPIHVPSGYPMNMTSHLFPPQNPKTKQNLPPTPQAQTHPTRPPHPPHSDFGRHNIGPFSMPPPRPAHHHLPVSHIMQQIPDAQKRQMFIAQSAMKGNVPQAIRSQAQQVPVVNTSAEKRPIAAVTTPQTSTCQPPEPKMVKIPNPFCLTPQIFPTRVNKLVRTEESHYNTRNGGCVNPAKALDLLRSVLQGAMNKEIKKVMDKYRHFFDAAAQNIRDNYGEKSVSESNIMSTFQDAMEQAKEIFKSDETSSIASGKTEGEDIKDEPVRKKFKPLTDASFIPTPRRRKGRPPLQNREYKPKNEPVKREGPKWDPVRLTEDTCFVMGAKANKALGLGATRGRLYYKHPELFKYAGDQQDKAWLYENGLMPATGGKAFILIVEDIYDLSKHDDYKDNAEVQLSEIKPFKVNATILEKMRSYMRSNRTDGNNS